MIESSPLTQWESERIAFERRNYRRIVIAFQDLGDVRAFTSRLLGLSPVSRIDPTDSVLTDALITSIVVGYGRCFTHSRTNGQVRSALPSTFEKTLSPHLKALHGRLLRLRHKEFAHSDGETADVTVSALPHFRNGALVPEARRLRAQSFSDAELESIPALLGRLHIYLYDELVRLNEALARYGNF